MQDFHHHRANVVENQIVAMNPAAQHRITGFVDQQIGARHSSNPLAGPSQFADKRRRTNRIILRYPIANLLQVMLGVA